MMLLDFYDYISFVSEGALLAHLSAGGAVFTHLRGEIFLWQEIPRVHLTVALVQHLKMQGRAR